MKIITMEMITMNLFTKSQYQKYRKAKLYMLNVLEDEYILKLGGDYKYILVFIMSINFLFIY